MPSVQIALMLRCVEICPLSWLLGAGSKWQGGVFSLVSIFLCWTTLACLFPRSWLKEQLSGFPSCGRYPKLCALVAMIRYMTWIFFCFLFLVKFEKDKGLFLKNYLFLMLGLAKTLLHQWVVRMYSSFKKGIAIYITFTTSRPLGFPVFRRDSNIECWGRSFSTSNARTDTY